MQGGISLRGPLIPASNNITSNYTRPFECHPNPTNHGTTLLSFALAGVGANVFLAALILARRPLRRWSSGLLLHGTFVDGLRAALLIPLALSVLRCQPVPKCSLIDTAFLLLATVTSLNLLSASLSDAPLLPPPALVPTLLQSAGFMRQESANHYASPLYPKAEYAPYYSDFYEDDSNLLAEKTAMPDSPQCVLFGTFMVWFAALTINLGPTFLSGALAAHSEALPRTTSCPLVRGPARHVILNALWASVNLLCVGLAAAHLRKLKKDLGRARLGLLAAAGAGLAGLTGIQAPGYTHTSMLSNKPAQSNIPSSSHHGSTRNLHKSSSTSMINHVATNAQPSTSSYALRSSQRNLTSTSSLHQPSGARRNPPHQATPAEVDRFLRQAQRNARSHIRSLGTLAMANLVCWVPLYMCAIFTPVGAAAQDEQVPFIFEVTLMLAFAHSVVHPFLTLFLHQPLRDGFRQCLWQWCCCVCNFCGMEFDNGDESPRHSRAELRAHLEMEQRSSSRASHHSGHHSIHGSHHGSHPRLHNAESLVSLKRSSSIKSARGLMMDPPSPLPDDLMLPPPPPPASSAFRKQVSLDETKISSTHDNRW